MSTKTNLLLFALFFLNSILGLQAQTTITGTISSNVTWTPADDPYIIDGFVSLPTGVNLTIAPGTVVKFLPYAAISVEGNIIANATSSEKIIFTSFLDDEIDGDTNQDGDATIPNTLEGGAIQFTNLHGGASSFTHCLFRYGGSSFELAMIELSGTTINMQDCQFEKCGLGVNFNGSSNWSFQDVSFFENDLALLNSSLSANLDIQNCQFQKNQLGIQSYGGAMLSIHHSLFQENSFEDINNQSTQNIDASLNQWDLSTYLLMAENDPTINIPSISDQLDNPIYGKVIYYPLFLPPLDIESVTPNTVNFPITNSTLTVSGFRFDPSTSLYLQNEDVIIYPSSTNVLDTLTIEADFSWEGEATGIYDVVAINSTNDTMVLEYGFNLLDVGFINFGEWVPFEATSGTSFTSAVEIPDIDELFIFVKKSTRLGYSNTWTGGIELTTPSQELLIDYGYAVPSGGSRTDIEIHEFEPDSGYFFEIKTTNPSGSGYVLFTTGPDTLELGQWDTGKILRPYGYDWKQIEVPEGLSSLVIQTEGFGQASRIEVLKDNLNDAPIATFGEIGNSYKIVGEIPNPEPGRYFIRYRDSAVLNKGGSNPYDGQKQEREYLIYVGSTAAPDNELPLNITGLSTYELGKGIASLEVSGVGFSENDSLYLKNNSGEIIAPIDKEFDEVNNIWTIFLDLVEASEGAWEVHAYNGMIDSKAPQGVNITAPEINPISVNLITSTFLREGRWRPIIFEVNNTSNVDSYMVPVFVQFEGTPELDNPELLEFPSFITDSVQGSQWDSFEGQFTSWNDVPYYLDQLDSATNITYRRVPVILPYIQANSKTVFQLNVRYVGAGDSEITAFALAPMIDNSDLNFRNGTSECFKMVIQTVVESFLPDPFACAAGVINSIQGAADFITGKKARDPISGVAYATSLAGTVATCAGAAMPAYGVVYKTISTFYGTFGSGLSILDCYEQATTPQKAETTVVGSTTPEDKFGIVGAEQTDGLPAAQRRNFINKTREFSYRIDYWNKEDATAPAAEVFIRDTIDENFDLESFNFTEIGFLRWSIPLDGGHYFNVNIDMRPDFNYIVNVEGSVDPFTREVYWVHRTLDPETLELPDDPFAGYLPPFDELGYNLGWVNYSIQARENLASGTVLQNQAHINFDGVGPWGPAPPYGPYTNTYDFDPPESSVSIMMNQATDTTFTLNWAGTDDDGCGIRSYDIYKAVNNQAFELYLAHTELTSIEFTGKRDSTYSFYSVALDKVGNQEIDTGEADATTTILTSLPAELSRQVQWQTLPNPAHDELSVLINSQINLSNTEIIINDLRGRVLLQSAERIQLGQQTLDINIESYSPGLYLLSLRSDQGVLQTKFIKL